jgi:peptidyl-Asp metalloendopeptidase
MFTTLLLAASAASFLPQVSSGNELPPTFLAPASLPGPGLDAGQAIEIQRSLVTLNTDLLAPISQGGSRRLEIELFGGESLTANLILRTPARGGFVWYGSILGEEDGEVLLSVVDQFVTASIRSQDRLFRISAAENGPVHYLAELDEFAFPECGTTAAHRVVGEVMANNGNGNGNRAPDVDIMVVYTKKARVNQGGTAAMESLINLAFTETNKAYTKSDVNQVLRLVHTYEIVNYQENGDFSTELSRLRAKNDGQFDEIHGLRNQYGADAVGMIINSSQYCGIAYLMTNPSNSFKSNAFSVTSRICATGYYSFGHETGHNFGSAHDRQNANTGAYSYSFGWRTSNNQYRTVMAYSPGTRLKFFSNPYKSKNGMPLGKVNSAENWRSLNDTATYSSNWRPTASTYDLTLDVVGSLVAGNVGNVLVTGSVNTNWVYLYNGSGPGTTTLPGLGVDLEIANGRKVLQKKANAAGEADMTKSLPGSLSGLTVYLQAVDQLGSLSPVVIDTIL